MKFLYNRVIIQKGDITMENLVALLKGVLGYLGMRLFFEVVVDLFF